MALNTVSWTAIESSFHRNHRFRVEAICRLIDGVKEIRAINAEYKTQFISE